MDTQLPGFLSEVSYMQKRIFHSHERNSTQTAEALWCTEDKTSLETACPTDDGVALTHTRDNANSVAFMWSVRLNGKLICRTTRVAMVSVGTVSNSSLVCVVHASTSTLEGPRPADVYIGVPAVGILPARTSSHGCSTNNQLICDSSSLLV